MFLALEERCIGDYKLTSMFSFSKDNPPMSAIQTHVELPTIEHNKARLHVK